MPVFRPIMLAADTVNKTPQSYQMKWAAYNKSIFTLDNSDFSTELKQDNNHLACDTGRFTRSFSQEIRVDLPEVSHKKFRLFHDKQMLSVPHKVRNVAYNDNIHL